MIPQAHFMAVVVRAFLIGCAVLLLVVGCVGRSSESSKEEKKEQGHTESTKEQGRSPQATSSEEARCEGTRKINVNLPVRFTTNDLPGCPNKGGLLLGTDKVDELAGEKGDDEVRGLGGSDDVMGGSGNDVLYGGSESDGLGGDAGDDVIYGGPGDDTQLEVGGDGQRDKLYCGEGRDTYWADKVDYVSSSCEKKLGNSAPGPSLPPKCTKSFKGDACRTVK